MEAREASSRIDVNGDDLFRGCLGNFFDVHAAFGRRHEDHTRRCAINENRQIQFACDVAAFFDINAFDFFAVRAGLVGDQGGAEHLFSVFADFFRALDDANAAFVTCFGFLEGAFTAATCMDLGFYHVNRASLGLGSFDGFLSGICNLAVRHGHTVFAKNFFRLVLMNIHVRSLSCLPYDFRWVRNLDFNVP